MTTLRLLSINLTQNDGKRSVKILIKHSFTTMAFNTKNKRKIVVEGRNFYWFHKFSKDILRLVIMTSEKTHSRIVCDFKYRDLWLYFKEIVEGDAYYDNKLLIITEGVLTPWVVRQVIDYAVSNGWKPFTKDKDFLIKDVAGSLDFNFWTETTTEERKSKI